jgi:TonB family protein
VRWNCLCAGWLALSTLSCASAGGRSGVVYREMLVEQPPALLTTLTPRYPAGEVPAGTRGTVVVQVVVQPDGQVDMSTIEIVRSNHPAFTEAARSVVPHFRFRPAEMARVECAMRDGQPVLRHGAPDCRGTPQRTGERVRAVAVLPFDFAPTK